NSCDVNNQTPLHLASRAGHLGLVRLLIMNNARIEVRNRPSANLQKNFLTFEPFSLLFSWSAICKPARLCKMKST
ncbi:hypothetical protein BGY98DRAFT_928025, partial [Russula aff. rugulosa BPL654]